MIKIGLDFAFKTCGIAVIGNKSLTYDSYDISSKKINVFDAQQLMINWIWEYIQPFIVVEHELIIEDVFSGINPKATINAARTQGGLIDRYVQKVNKHPKLVMAASARKYVGVSARLQKAELQLWVIDKLKLAEIPNSVRSQVVSLPIQFERDKQKFLSQNKVGGTGRKKILKKLFFERKKLYNKSMGQLSTEIAKLTTINEHVADAVILAMQ